MNSLQDAQSSPALESQFDSFEVEDITDLELHSPAVCSSCSSCSCASCNVTA